MNQPYPRVNQSYATLTLASALREMFGVQLYKNNARALLLRILSILNLDWLQHARSVRGVYELIIICSFCNALHINPHWVLKAPLCDSRSAHIGNQTSGRQAGFIHTTRDQKLLTRNMKGFQF